VVGSHQGEGSGGGGEKLESTGSMGDVTSPRRATPKAFGWFRAGGVISGEGRGQWPQERAGVASLFSVAVAPAASGLSVRFWIMVIMHELSRSRKRIPRPGGEYVLCSQEILVGE
jgi:hypothetical protein